LIPTTLVKFGYVVMELEFKISYAMTIICKMEMDAPQIAPYNKHFIAWM
jgi:hypothetical protein